MQSTCKHLEKLCFMNLLFAILFLILGQASSARIEGQSNKILIHHQANSQEVELRKIRIEKEIEKSAGTNGLVKETKLVKWQTHFLKVFLYFMPCKQTNV